MTFAKNAEILGATLRAVAATKEVAIRHKPWIFYAGENPHATTLLLNKQLEGSPAAVNNGFVEVANKDITAVAVVAQKLGKALEPSKLGLVGSRSAYVINGDGLFDVNSSLVQYIKNTTGLKAATGRQYNLQTVVFTGSNEQIYKLKAFFTRCHEGYQYGLASAAVPTENKQPQARTLMTFAFQGGTPNGLAAAANRTIVERSTLPSYRGIFIAAADQPNVNKVTTTMQETPSESFKNAIKTVAANASSITFSAPKTVHKEIWHVAQIFGGGAQLSYRQGQPGNMDYTISGCNNYEENKQKAESVQGYMENVIAATQSRGKSSKNFLPETLSLADALTKLDDAHKSKARGNRPGM